MSYLDYFCSGTWLDAPPPFIENEAKIRSVTIERKNQTEYQMKFAITGSFLYSLQIRPKSGVKLLKWNLLDKLQEEINENGFTGYIVMVNHGLAAPPLQVILTFSVSKKLNIIKYKMSKFTLHF